MGYQMDDYVDVAQRIRELREKYPNAVLRPWNPSEPFRIMEIGGREFIVYVAACYRTPDDPMPAVAVAAEPAIGKTNFTRDSEVMNAETSAWGRCIVAALAADTKRIASREEVANRQADRSADESRREHPANLAVVKPLPATQPRSTAPSGAPSPDGAPSQKQLDTLARLLSTRGVTDDEFPNFAEQILRKHVATVDALTKRDASALLSYLLEGKTK